MVRADEGVISQQLHPETLGAAGHFRANPAQTDHAQIFIADFDAHKGAAPPFAPLQRLVGLGNVAGQGQHQGQRVLGGGHGVADGRVDHGDTGAGSRVQVDVIHADAGPADYLEPAPRLNNLSGDLGFAANHQGIVFPDSLQQFFRFQTVFSVHLSFGAQQFDPFGVNGVRN